MWGTSPWGTGPWGVPGGLAPVVVVPSGMNVVGLITLYQLDTSTVGSVGRKRRVAMTTLPPILYFTSATDFNTPITWGGQVYSPVPMDGQGFEMRTRGSLPTPTITISNLLGTGNLLVSQYGGLIGAQLTRILTLRRFLDDGTTPDPTAFITRDKFVVAQKTSHNALQIAFKLAARVDVEGTQLPRRQILRDVCSHTYRFWNPDTGAFDYSDATCPYTGSLYFDINNNATTAAANDQCSRNLQGCQLRFPAQPLPARFFPGVGKVK